MKTIGLTVLGIIRGVAGCVSIVSAASLLWGWFMVPAGLPAVSFLTVLGGVSLVTLAIMPWFAYASVALGAKKLTEAEEWGVWAGTHVVLWAGVLGARIWKAVLT